MDAAGFFRALKAGDTEKTLDMLEGQHGKEYAGLRDAGRRGSRPLHWAAYLGNVSVCEKLVEKRAGLRAVERDGKTALHVAAAEGHLKVVIVLLSALKDQDLATPMNEYQWSPRTLSTRNGHEEIAKLLSVAFPSTSPEDHDLTTNTLSERLKHFKSVSSILASQFSSQKDALLRASRLAFERRSHEATLLGSLKMGVKSIVDDCLKDTPRDHDKISKETEEYERELWRRVKRDEERKREEGRKRFQVQMERAREETRKQRSVLEKQLQKEQQEEVKELREAWGRHEAIRNFEHTIFISGEKCCDRYEMTVEEREGFPVWETSDGSRLYSENGRWVATSRGGMLFRSAVHDTKSPTCVHPWKDADGITSEVTCHAETGEYMTFTVTKLRCVPPMVNPGDIHLRVQHKSTGITHNPPLHSTVELETSTGGSCVVSLYVPGVWETLLGTGTVDLCTGSQWVKVAGDLAVFIKVSQHALPRRPQRGDTLHAVMPAESVAMSLVVVSAWGLPSLGFFSLDLKAYVKIRYADEELKTTVEESASLEWKEPFTFTCPSDRSILLTVCHASLVGVDQEIASCTLPPTSKGDQELSLAPSGKLRVVWSKDSQKSPTPSKASALCADMWVEREQSDGEDDDSEGTASFGTFASLEWMET